jgi:hypothetical protein
MNQWGKGGGVPVFYPLWDASDFMFILNTDEFEVLRCQIGTSKSDPRGGTRYAPMAFTEQGVAMLSGVLNSERSP